MIYELFLQMREMQNVISSLSTQVMALAIMAKINPEELGEKLSKNYDEIKEFAAKINASIKNNSEKNTEPQNTNEQKN